MIGGLKQICNIYYVISMFKAVYVCRQCVCEYKSIHRTRRSLPASDLNERLPTSYLHTSFFISSSLTLLADWLMLVSSRLLITKLNFYSGITKRLRDDRTDDGSRISLNWAVVHGPVNDGWWARRRASNYT